MGLLRLFLAYIVTVAHSAPLLGIFTFSDGRVAVELFFIISGFYIGHILTTKYKDTEVGRTSFYKARALRLYPYYWIALIITVILLFIPHINYMSEKSGWFLITPWEKENPLIQGFVNFSTVFIFGQELTQFIIIQATNLGNLLLTPVKFAYTLSIYLPIPQSWTLAHELVFYFLAPYINRLNTKRLFILFATLIAVRIVCYFIGFNEVPWSYRLLIFELPLFLGGMLASRYYSTLSKDVKTLKIAKLLTLLTFTLIVVYQFIPLNYDLKRLLLFAFFMCTIPYIFLLTKDNIVDRAIGEYSYPVYLLHYTVILHVFPFIQMLFPIDRGLASLYALVICLPISYLMIRFVGLKIEKYRSKLYLKH